MADDDRDLLLAHWRFEAAADHHALVPPDGCCDILWRAQAGQAPVLVATDLTARTYAVPVSRGDRFVGLRLRPGVRIDRAALAALPAAAAARLVETGEALDRIAVRDAAAAEALDAIAGIDVPGDGGGYRDPADGALSAVARALGVSPRTLQRRVGLATGRAPGWWRRLARVRRTAVALADTRTPLAALALGHGYADQAHMTREIQAWLAVTPTALRGNGRLAASLRAAGYGS